MFRRFSIGALAALLFTGAVFVAGRLASPVPAFAASKEIQELQRDVAQLQDMVRQLQRSQDEKFAALQVLVQQSLNSANDANKAVAVIQNGFQQNLRDMETKVVAPVAGLSQRIDGMSDSFHTTQQAVTDLTSAVARIQTQLNDINNQLKVIQTPAAPPPAQPGVGPGPGQGAIPPQGMAASPAPCMGAVDLLTNADRDYNGGNMSLALQDYAEYLRCHGNTAEAPKAQYYIGWIHYSQGDFENAANDFDAVLEKYSSDNRYRPQAFYYKGVSLVKLGQKTAAQAEFRELMKQFPNNELSKKACSQLTEIGYRCTVPRAAAPAKNPARRKK